MDNKDKLEKEQQVNENEKQVETHDHCEGCEDCKDGECKDCETDKEPAGYEETISVLNKKFEAEKEARLSVMADYMNFRKRVEKDKEELHIMANKRMLEQIIELVDDFDRAVHMEADKIDVENDFYKGIMIIHKKMTDLLASYGLSEIEIKEGDNLDPMTMQAVAMAPVTEKDKVNKVIHIAGKGFIDKSSGKVFKTAKVIIGKE